jgi:inosine/xanthosine triphosphate pyrophosphatase family protein
MPCNPEFQYYKSGTGKDKIVLANGTVVSGMILSNSVGADGYGYVSHFATCKHAKMFSRK